MSKSFRIAKTSFILIVLFLSINIQIQAAAADAGVHEDELRRIQKFESFVRRNGDTLRLKLKSGVFMELENSGECSGWDSCEEYEFLDYLKDAGFYHIYLYLGERSEHLMLSDKTGQKFEVHSAPQLSPDRKHFITVSASESFDVNGVFIWRFNGGQITQEFSYEPEEYALYSFEAWLDDKTIRLLKFTRSVKYICPASDFMTVPVLLKLDGNVWRFHEDLSIVKCNEATN